MSDLHSSPLPARERWQQRIGLPDEHLIEYCQRCQMPLAFIRAARDEGQRKEATTLEGLARASNVIALCVLYTPAANPCTCDSTAVDDRCDHGIEAMRIRWVYPDPGDYEAWSPGDFARWLTELHDSHERHGSCQPG